MNEVVLFPTCLAEEFFPEARDAASNGIERLRVKVRTMPRVFCCGQAGVQRRFSRRGERTRAPIPRMHASRVRRS